MIPNIENRLRAIEDRAHPASVELGVVMVPAVVLPHDQREYIAGELARRFTPGQRGGVVILPAKGSA